MFPYKDFLVSIITTFKKRGRQFWAYINKTDSLYIFWVTLIYYFISILNLNNKTLFVSLIALGIVYNVRFRNLRFSLLFTTVASLIFLVGKTWIIQLIPPQLLTSSDYPRGYISVVVITPLQIFAFLVFVVLTRDVLFNHLNIRKKLMGLFTQKSVIFLLLFFLWQVFSAAMAESGYSFPLIYSLQSLVYLVIFIGLITYSFLERSYCFNIASLFGAMVIFETSLAVFQWLRRSTLGLAIEPIEEMLTYFKGPGQGFFSVRSVGTFAHPNELALFSLFTALFFLSFLYLSKRRLQIRKIYYFYFFGAAFLGLILSLGRSAWLSFFICLLIFCYFVEKRWGKHFIKLKKITAKHFLYFILFSAIFLLLTISRMAKLFDLFQPMGGGETRLKLIEESLYVIKLRPFLGTGMGLSGYTMFLLHPRGIIANLPSTVHNFYLLLAAESGLPALSFFLLFLIFLLKKLIDVFNNIKVDDKIRLLGITVALFAMLINGAMHQIFFMGFFLVATTFLFIPRTRA